MKTTINNVVKFFAIVLILLSANANAQDPISIAPKNYKKVLLDNDNVRVLKFEMAPNEIIPWHSHPNHVIYAITGGKIEITDENKPPFTIDVKEGDALFIPAVTHMAKNIGFSTIKLVITEIKK